jgi:prevent-host-death family protein
MPEVSITEAKRGFFRIIKRVMQGEVFVITRWGKPVVTLARIAGTTKQTNSAR